MREVEKMRKLRTKRYNPECHVNMQIAGSEEVFEEIRRDMRKKARKHKEQTGQDMSYEINKVD